jgi:hypothetical protein
MDRKIRMHNLKAGIGTWTGFGLVRDKNGKPKIDDPTNIPQPIWDMLTEQEQEDIKDGLNTHNRST